MRFLFRSLGDRVLPSVNSPDRSSKWPCHHQWAQDIGGDHFQEQVRGHLLQNSCALGIFMMNWAGSEDLNTILILSQHQHESAGFTNLYQFKGLIKSQILPISSIHRRIHQYTSHVSAQFLCFFHHFHQHQPAYHITPPFTPRHPTMKLGPARPR